MDRRLDAYLRIKSAAKDIGSALAGIKNNQPGFLEDLASDTSLLDKARLKFYQGQSLGHGYNGNPSFSDDGKTYTHSTHSAKSRARQLAALGLSGLGTAGGAIGGYKLTKMLSDKLGLDKDEYDENGKKKKKSLIKRLAKAGLITAGTVGGGLGGYALGTTGAGFMNGLPNTEEGRQATHLGEVLAKPKYRKAIKNYIKNVAKSEGVNPLEAYLTQKAVADWITPINPM